MAAHAYVAFQQGAPAVLFSAFFSGLSAASSEPQSQRAARLVASVSPAWTFSRQAAARHRAERGVVPVREGDETRVAVWHAAANVCHVVVCEPSANVELALNFLQVFAAVLADHCKGGAMETFLVKPDEAMVLLGKFLPLGRFLVLTSALAKDLKQESDMIILDKK